MLTEDDKKKKDFLRDYKIFKNIDKGKTLKAIGEISRKNDEANKLLSEFRKIDEILDNSELVCTKTYWTKFDFNRFLLPLKLIEKIIIMKLFKKRKREIAF